MRWRETLAAHMPLPAAKLVYRILFLVTRLWILFLSPKTSAWPRNSVALGTVQFALSDIDLTVMVSSEDEVKRVQKKARFFPLVREIHWYRKQSLGLCLSWMNPIELARDPRLKSEVLAQNLSFSNTVQDADRLVFLLRKFESCRQQFMGSVDWQPLKWASYFSLAQIEGAPKSPDEFYRALDTLAERLNLGVLPSVVLKKYLTGLQAGQPLHLMIESFSLDNGERDLILSLLPHRFCFLEPKGHAAHPNIMAAQVCWEFWGLETQRVGEYLPRQLDHLKRLTKWQAFSQRPEQQNPQEV